MFNAFSVTSKVFPKIVSRTSIIVPKQLPKNNINFSSSKKYDELVAIHTRFQNEVGNSLEKLKEKLRVYENENKEVLKTIQNYKDQIAVAEKAKASISQARQKILEELAAEEGISGKIEYRTIYRDVPTQRSG
jgi:DNA-binding transcriptional MerR regulator